MNEITDGLQDLIARGFNFAHPRDSDGSLIAVVGIRVHHGVIDVVQLYDEHEAIASRIPGDEPDILSPRSVLWHTTGDAMDVLKEMRTLPEPALEQAQDTNGCWVPTQAGRSVWLAASA